jgi:hypothetical protein
MADKTEENKKREVDPQHVFVKAGKKDPSKVYVSVPFNYRDAQAEIKKLGAKWMGDNWEIDKDKFEAAEADIRNAAQADIDLGKEGRKERETALKAEAEKAKADKPAKKELTEEEKAAKAEAGRKAALERDAKRLPCLAENVEAGTEMTVNDVAVKTGRPFELDDKGAADINERFETDVFKAGDTVAYANVESADDKAKLSIADLNEAMQAAPAKELDDSPAP